MEIIPQGNRILVEFEDVKASDIVLPDSVAQGDFAVWRVRAVGEGRLLESGQRVPIAIGIGDEVAILKRAISSLGPMYGPRKLAIADVDGVVAIIRRPKDAPAPAQIRRARQLAH